MKTYYKSIMAIHLTMISFAVTLFIAGLINNNVFMLVGGSSIGVYFILSILYLDKDYKNGKLAEQIKEAEELKKELDAKEHEIKQIKPKQTIYSQFSSLTKEEILWLHDHVQNQKDALTQVNTNNRENYIGIINTFSENKMFENLAEDTRKELEAWDEFYLEHSTMIASILPKLDAMKEAVS